MQFKNLATKELKYINIVVYIVVLFGITACATVGSPVGGPKDLDRPYVVLAVPENYTTNFDANSFEITFNEFIQLKSVNQELLVSPPLQNRPEIREKGKSFEVVLREDSLRPNTTYTFFFGNAIADNNEGNLLPDYEYVFSTGSYIDSLSVKGRVLDAFTLKPLEDGALVMLHSNLNDSAPYLSLPDFISRTNKEGYFSINNVRPDLYRLMALKDQNNNYLFDLPAEPVAFADSLVNLDPQIFARIDSLIAARKDSLFVADSLMRQSLAEDSTYMEGDTVFFQGDSIIIGKPLSPDSLVSDSVIRSFYDAYNLFYSLQIFTEDNARQYLKETIRDDRRKLMFIFNRPVTDSVQIEPYQKIDTTDWTIRENLPVGDSIIFWLTDTSMINNDSLVFRVEFTALDSLRNPFRDADTLALRYRETKTVGRRSRSDEEEEKPVEEKVSLSFNVKARGVMDLNKSLIITSMYPLHSYLKDSINLVMMEDTLEKPVDFSVSWALENRRTITLRPSEWEPNESYKLLLYPGAIQNVYGHTNDTTEHAFRTQKDDAYGNLILNIENLNVPAIIQLLDKDKVIAEKYLSESGQVFFNYLTPSTYSLKLIYDRNGNMQWDTGRYLEQKQPEQVIFKENPIPVRANWDLEQTWVLPENPE